MTEPADEVTCGQPAAMLALFGAGMAVALVLTGVPGIVRMGWHALRHDGDLRWLRLR